MEPVSYDVHIRKVLTYHGTLKIPVPGDKISPDFEEGYARGFVEMAIAGHMFDERAADWDEQFEIEYEVVDAELTVGHQLADIEGPVDAGVITAETFPQVKKGEM